MIAREHAVEIITWILAVASVAVVIYIMAVLYSGYWPSQSGASGSSGSSAGSIFSSSGSSSEASDSERMTKKFSQTTSRVPSDSPLPPVPSARASAASDKEQEVDSDVEPAPESEVATASAAGAKLLEETDDSDYEPGTANKKAALPVAESATERSARLIRETLGLKEPEAPQAAVIVELMVAESCETKAGLETSLPILYRFESPTIRTSSVNELRSLLSQYRSCENSEFHMMLSGIETSEELALMRFNELKYFFTQNSVPKSALHYYDTP